MGFLRRGKKDEDPVLGAYQADPRPVEWGATEPPAPPAAGDAGDIVEQMRAMFPGAQIGVGNTDPTELVEQLRAAFPGAQVSAGDVDRDALREQLRAAFAGAQINPAEIAAQVRAAMAGAQMNLAPAELAEKVRAASAGAQPAGDDQLARLERAAALHASGAITDEEFAAVKARLLG